MSPKTLRLTLGAGIAALYAALTLLSAFAGLAFGPVQLRLSEALTVLPVFSAASVPGLAVGCLAANLFSTVSPLDAVVGTLATLIAALLTRKLRNVRIKNLPLLSFLSPVFVNALFVGAQLAFFSGGGRAFLPVFGVTALTVGLSEAFTVAIFGGALWLAVRKNRRLGELLAGPAALPQKKGKTPINTEHRE